MDNISQILNTLYTRVYNEVPHIEAGGCAILALKVATELLNRDIPFKLCLHKPTLGGIGWTKKVSKKGINSIFFGIDFMNGHLTAYHVYINYNGMLFSIPSSRNLKSDIVISNQTQIQAILDDFKYTTKVKGYWNPTYNRRHNGQLNRIIKQSFSI